jgi:hypothetical protein
VRGTDAVKALGAVVDYVLMRRGVEKLNLIGWSWGPLTKRPTSGENSIERAVRFGRTALLHDQGAQGAISYPSRCTLLTPASICDGDWHIAPLSIAAGSLKTLR